MRIKLFDSKPTSPQQAVVGFWLLNLGAVAILWASTVHFGSLASWLLAIGQLLGLLATYFALTQFMLMGRIGWIERNFGLDHLASYHRINGYLAISFLLVHPIFITAGYALNAKIGLFQQYTSFITSFSFVWLALIAEILFVIVVASSIYIARKRLKFETWYFVHLLVYLAIVSASLHQFKIGGSFVANQYPLANAYWIGLYAFVAVNLLVWRFGLPVYNLLRYQFRVQKVVKETATTTSVYISGRGLKSWKSKPGQFILVRIFAKSFWWQEHPFSLSWIPHDNQIRLTIRHVGDYTAAIEKLRPGARVLLSGPFGRFTNDVSQTDKRLFIAGGVGITPIRSLIEEAVASKRDCVLLYANREPGDVVFKDELSKLAGNYLKIISVFSDPPKGYQGPAGYVDAAAVEKYVSDYLDRDVYICGPPPMMNGLIQGLSAAEVPEAQIHYERFALHN